MRKTAIKVAILFVVGLFICVLVSRAVTYLTAPKGDFVKQQKAYIYKEYTHTGSIEFINQEDIYWKEALNRPLQITEVYIKTGDYVEEGDSLFTFELYQDAQEEKMALEKELQTLAQTKTALYETILKMRVKLESRGVQLAREYVEIQARILVLKSKIQDALAEEIEWELSSHEETLKEPIQQENVSEDTIADIQEYLSLTERLREMQPALDKELKRGNNTDYQIGLKWYELQQEMDEVAQKLAELERLEKQPISYTAPKRGRITAVYGKIGDVYNGVMPLFAVSSSEFP
ncbi:MAG: hypothetical protein ACOX6S_01640 [Clostridia bacterium]|jgi:multidrug resistance efflux pump